MRLTKIAIVLAAVLAMSTGLTSGASAHTLKSNVSTVSLSGTDTVNNVFTVDGQKVTCSEAKFATGSMAVPANQITMNTVHTGCTAFGFAGATVNMGNCHTRFTTPDHFNTNEHTSYVDIVCKDTTGQNGGANVINVKSSVFGSTCSVSIGEKTEIAHAWFIRVLNKQFRLWMTLSNITATKNEDNGLCPLSGTGTVNNATYNGEVILSDNGGNEIFIE